MAKDTEGSAGQSSTTARRRAQQLIRTAKQTLQRAEVLRLQATAIRYLSEPRWEDAIFDLFFEPVLLEPPVALAVAVAREAVAIHSHHYAVHALAAEEGETEESILLKEEERTARSDAHDAQGVAINTACTALDERRAASSGDLRNRFSVVCEELGTNTEILRAIQRAQRIVDKVDHDVREMSRRIVQAERLVARNFTAQTAMNLLAQVRELCGEGNLTTLEEILRRAQEQNEVVYATARRIAEPMLKES